MKIACIGSREITDEEAEMCEEIGSYIVGRGWYLATGNALGADEHYAAGAGDLYPEKVMLYLPWRTYNDCLIQTGNRILWQPKEEWRELAKGHHPGWDRLSQGAQKMMLRNAGIVKGSAAVIAILNHGKPGFGGTGHGWRIAQTLGIPHLDLRTNTNWKLFLEQVEQMKQEGV